MSESSATPSIPVPREPGAYWWRAKAGDEWALVQIYLHQPDLFRGGEWVPCLPPGEEKSMINIEMLEALREALKSAYQALADYSYERKMEHIKKTVAVLEGCIAKTEGGAS